MIKTDSYLSVHGAVRYLPQTLGNALCLFVLKNEKTAKEINEIRLRAGGAFSVSPSGRDIFFDLNGNICKRPVICTEDDIEECVRRLCDGSYHSHEDEIKNGFISMKNGMRAGIAPTYSSNGEIYFINSVNIRLPKEVHGVSDELFEKTGVSSTLIYSPPGVGKTTVLKDMIRNFSAFGIRCAVIDARSELSANRFPLADYFLNGEKSRCIESAVRTMCPQMIVCDEIGSDESSGIIEAANSGVPFTATCHASSFDELLRRPFVKKLYEAHVFDNYAGLTRCGNTVLFDIKCVS